VTPGDPESMPEQQEPAGRHIPHDGVVPAVRGAVVDVVFAGSDLRPIKSALVVAWDRPSRTKANIQRSRE